MPIANPSADMGDDLAGPFLKAAAAHMKDNTSKYQKKAIQLSGIIGVGMDLPRLQESNPMSLLDSFIGKNKLLWWNQPCRQKWSAILTPVVPKVVPDMPSAVWLPKIVPFILDACEASPSSIVPFSTVLDEVLRLKHIESLRLVGGETRKGWMGKIDAAIKPHGLTITGTQRKGYYVWRAGGVDDAAHTLYHTVAQQEESEAALEMVANATQAVVVEQPVAIVLNDAAMLLHETLVAAKPKKKEAFYGPGISMQSVIEYVGGPPLINFITTALTGSPYMPDQPDDDAMGGGPGQPAERPREYYQAANLASCMMMCYSGIAGPWQSALSNELRGANMPTRLQDRLSFSGVSGNSKYSREQENAYANDTDSSARGTLIASAEPLAGKTVVNVSSDNCDWENGGSTDGNAGTHIINMEARILHISGVAPDMIWDQRKKGPLVGVAPPIEDETPDSAPIVSKNTPTLAPAAARAAVAAKVNADGATFMRDSQQEDLAWVLMGMGTRDDGTIEPRHPEWTEFNKHIRKGQTIPPRDYQLPLAPIMLDPVSPEGIKAILERCMELKRETNAAVVFLDCDVGEWVKIVQQLFAKDYEKHIIPMQGGFHTMTKVRFSRRT